VAAWTVTNEQAKAAQIAPRNKGRIFCFPEDGRVVMIKAGAGAAVDVHRL
jgi:hypothetical protein